MQFIFTRFQSKMPPSQNENIHYNLCTFFLYKIMQWKICLIEIFHCSTYVNTALIIFFFKLQCSSNRPFFTLYIVYQPSKIIIVTFCSPHGLFFQCKDIYCTVHGGIEKCKRKFISFVRTTPYISPLTVINVKTQMWFLMSF